MDVITRSQAGDGEAFAELFHQYKNLVYRTAYLMLNNGQEAEDALQEVFLKVHRTLETYDPGRGALTTWLYRITVNHCLNERRRSAPVIVPLVSSNGHGPSVEGQVADDDEMARALAGLSEKLKAVVVLRYYAGLAYAEIAEALDVPLGTVKSRLNQALAELRVRLEPEGTPDPDRIGGKEVAR
jgi:RNA polymerase sigma-70 factor, ECF subfamily